MARKFRLKLTQTIVISFSGEGATEKSAKYVAEKIACCYVKEGYSKNIETIGRFDIRGEPDAVASEIKEIDK